MTVDEVKEWFGNLNKACLALKIASQNMTKWKQQGYIPWKQQFKIAVVTEGALMPDDEDPHIVRNPKKPKVIKKRTRKVNHANHSSENSSVLDSVCVSTDRCSSSGDC